jgi:hypothetical protein
VLAVLLAGALHLHRQRREAGRRAARRAGGRIIAELPAGADLTFFSEDEARFYYGDRTIEKDGVRAVQVLVNGSPIASCVSPRFPEAGLAASTGFEDRPDGIARDRWDVAIDTTGGVLLVECGAIRERISQEIARAIFDAIKRDLERRDRR